jgi:mannosyltransferase
MLLSDAGAKQESDAAPRDVSPDSGRGVVALTLLASFAAGVVLRFLFLVRKPFWFDEAFSVEVARLDWRNFLHLLSWREANMSLYYVLLRGWLHLGQGEFFIRSLSVVAAVATLPALYWLGRLLFNRRVALIAVTLVSFNAYHVRYAQEARSYAVFVLLGTLSSAFFVTFLREPSHRNRTGYVLTSTLVVYAHFYALLLVAAHWLAWCLRPHTADISGAISAGDEGGRGLVISAQMRHAWIWIGVSVLPLLIFVGKLGAGPIRWIQRPSFHDLLEYYEHMAGNDGLPLLALYAAACAAAIAPVAKRLLGRVNVDWETWRIQFLLLWLLFPVALTVLLSWARPVFLGRYMVFCLPAFVVLAAAGLARLRPAWLLGPALAVVLLLSLQGTLAYYDHDFDLARDGAGAATDYVLDRAQPGDVVVFHIAETRVAYEFFRSLRSGANSADEYSGASFGPKIVYPDHGGKLDYRDFTGKPTSEFLRSLSARYGRVWVVLMNNGSPAAPDPTTLMLTQILGEAFPQMRRAEFSRVEVRIYSGQ